MTSEQRRQQRLNRPPSWKSAIQKGAVAAVVLFVLVALVFDTSVGAAIPIAVLAAAIYIPAFYMTDSMLYRGRMRRRAREQELARRADASD
jgi:hypothetical protein